VYTRAYTGKPCHAGVSTGGGIVPCVIDHDSPVPLHEQLARILRTMITDGRIAGRVPSILTLAQEYGVSHRTSQRALTTLADEGLIVAVRGKGFYVKRNQS
jgi:DNA-binding GntR family transcriptional regulator